MNDPTIAPLDVMMGRVRELKCMQECLVVSVVLSVLLIDVRQTNAG